MKGNKGYLWLLILAAVALSACTPVNIRPMAKPDPANETTVVVYRGSALNAGALDMVLGVDGNDVVEMSNSTIATLELVPGQHDLFVRSTQADKPYHLPLLLEQGKTVCLEGKPDPANFGKGLVGFLYFMTSTFELNAAPCLTDDAAKAYAHEMVPNYTSSGG